MIVVHHLDNSRSQRVLWLLEELGLEYEIRFYKRDKMTMLAPKVLRDIHPLGKSPVITDNGETIAESGAIIEYLVEKYGSGRLRPAAGTKERIQYTYWLHYAEGSAMPPLLLKLIFEKLPTQPMPFFVRPIVQEISKKALNSFIDPQLKEHLDFMESALSKSRWFAGEEFTAADVQMSFPIEAGLSRSSSSTSRPNLRQFLQHIHSRSAYQRALERGGPYEILS